MAIGIARFAESIVDKVITINVWTILRWILFMKMNGATSDYRPQEESAYAGYHLAYEVKKLMYAWRL